MNLTEIKIGQQLVVMPDLLQELRELEKRESISLVPNCAEGITAVEVVEVDARCTSYPLQLRWKPDHHALWFPKELIGYLIPVVPVVPVVKKERRQFDVLLKLSAVKEYKDLKRNKVYRKGTMALCSKYDITLQHLKYWVNQYDMGHFDRPIAFSRKPQQMVKFIK